MVLSSLHQLLIDGAARFGHAPAVRLPDAVLSHRELRELADRAGNVFLERGVRRGDVVACLAGNQVATLATWFGAHAIGAVFMPVNPLLQFEPLRRVLDHAGASVVVVADDLAGALGTAGSASPRLVLTSGGGDEPFEALLDAASSTALPVIHEASARSKLMYTSGTTGEPKGVVWSRGCEANHARFYGEEMVPIETGEQTYCCLPLTHVTCQGTAMGTWSRGGCITIDAGFDAFGFWNRMRSLDIVQFSYVGTILSVLGRRRPRPDDADNPVRRILGAAAPGALWRPIEQRFDLHIVDVWGQTETASCWTNPDTVPQTPGTLGRPVDRWEPQLVDRADATVTEAGVVGELWMRPTRDNVLFTGYLRSDGAVDEPFDADGWYRTGDLMHWTDEGDLAFGGRLREAVRRRGEMIATVDIEEAALASDEIDEAAAVGVPADDGVEEEIKLCVVAVDGQSVDAVALHAYLRTVLPRFMVPRYIAVMDELPKTPSTRVRKFALRALGTVDAWDAKRR